MKSSPAFFSSHLPAGRWWLYVRATHPSCYIATEKRHFRVLFTWWSFSLKSLARVSVFVVFRLATRVGTPFRGVKSLTLLAFANDSRDKSNDARNAVVSRREIRRIAKGFREAERGTKEGRKFPLIKRQLLFLEGNRSETGRLPRIYSGECSATELLAARIFFQQEHRTGEHSRAHESLTTTTTTTATRNISQISLFISKLSTFTVDLFRLVASLLLSP